MTTKDSKVNQRVIENMGLSHYIAKKFFPLCKTGHIEMEDIQSVAYIGLIEACKRFDENYGVKFTTYAYAVIEGRIRRFLRDGSPGTGGIRFGRSYKEAYMLIVKEGLEGEDAQYVSEKLGISMEFATRGLLYGRHKHASSLSKTVYEEEGQAVHLEDCLGESNEHIESTQNQFIIRDFMRHLNDDEAQLLQLYCNGYSQRELAETFGMSQVTISRRLSEIFRKARQYGEGLKVTSKKKYNKSKKECSLVAL